MTEVRKSVLKLKNRKAAGIDRLVYEALKNENCVSVHVDLFDKCLDTDLLPTNMTKGHH